MIPSFMVGIFSNLIEIDINLERNIINLDMLDFKDTLVSISISHVYLYTGVVYCLFLFNHI